MMRRALLLMALMACGPAQPTAAELRQQAHDSAVRQALTDAIHLADRSQQASTTDPALRDVDYLGGQVASLPSSHVIETGKMSNDPLWTGQVMAEFDRASTIPLDHQSFGDFATCVLYFIEDLNAHMSVTTAYVKCPNDPNTAWPTAPGQVVVIDTSGQIRTTTGNSPIR
jgi:hypothetical protein